MPFVDLLSQQARISDRLRELIDGVLAHGQFILGPEVAQFEQLLARYVGTRHVVSCANGTDALVLALRALGLPSGAGVLVPGFTFCATAEAVVLAGGVPVFVDVDPATFNIDPEAVRKADAWCSGEGVELAGVIAVDLFGLPADYDPLHQWGAETGRWVLADAAQSIGAAVGKRRAGSLAALTTTSFFPAKPLGCYGDGGAICTDDDTVAEQLRSLRFHGKGEHQYDNVRIGYNSRLDTMQAAVLIAKLEVLEEEQAHRAEVAARYSAALADIVDTPVEGSGRTSAWAQYTVQIRAEDRDEVARALRAEGIPTSIYYARPLHRQPAYLRFPVAGGSLPVAEQLCERVLSLPIHPYLPRDDRERIVATIHRAHT